jgi:hypothetical protein
LAGCASGDPDGDGTSGIDMEILNEMIDDNLQDFINNTSVTVVNNHYSNESNEVTNHINSTSSDSVYRIMTGAIAGVENTGNISSENDHVLLVRGDVTTGTNSSSIFSFDGADICVKIGSSEEGKMVNWFSHNNISFTSVPVADTAEATSKFIDGSCDAIEGLRSYIEAKKMQLENDGSMNGVEIWISAPMGQLGELYAIESRVDFTLEQEYGTVLDIGNFYAEISVEGNCVADCNSSDLPISITFTSPNSDIVEMFSVCSIPDYGLIEYNDVYFMLPGLDCTLTISLHAYVEYERDNYEYVWSDWAYYMTLSESEVTMEE